MSGGHAHSVKRHLDIDADGYDVQIRRFIPYYDDMLATGVELLAALAPAGGHVLDLGGGTGALSAAVLEGLPGVHVTVLDVDPDMLGEAHRRLSAYGERVAFKEGTFLDPLPRADAVVASLALHHVHDLQTKPRSTVPGVILGQVRSDRVAAARWVVIGGVSDGRDAFCYGLGPVEAVAVSGAVSCGQAEAGGLGDRLRGRAWASGQCGHGSEAL